MKSGPLRSARMIESGTIRIGRACSWTLILLMGVVVFQILLRHLFDRELIGLSELQWHLYAIVVMFSLSHAQAHRAHVRVDLWHRGFRPTFRRKFEVLIMLVLVLPLSAFLVWEGAQFAWEAWRIEEKSPAPGGLPWRWMVKSLIPVGAAILFANGVATAIRAAGGEEDPVDADADRTPGWAGPPG